MNAMTSISPAQRPATARPPDPAQGSRRRSDRSLRRPPRLILLALAAGLLLAARPAETALAHGGLHTLQLDRVPTVGGRHLSLWTGPSVLRPGQVLLEGLVSDPASGEAVEGLRLRYELVYQGGHHEDPPLDLPAQPVATLSERNLKEELHLAVVELQEIGPYQVTVYAAEGDGPEVASQVTLQVVPLNPWLKPILYALALLTGLITVAFVLHTFGRLRGWWRGRTGSRAG